MEDIKLGDLLIYNVAYKDTAKSVYKVTSINNTKICLAKAHVPQSTWEITREALQKFTFANRLKFNEVYEILSNASWQWYLENVLLHSGVQEDTKLLTSNMKSVISSWEDATTGLDKEEAMPKKESFTTTGEIKMQDLKNRLVESNKNAAKAASLVTAGNVLNKTLVAKLKPQLPMLMRGYADHPLAEVVVANIATVAIQNFASNNEKAAVAADAMMMAAMQTLTNSLNIEGIVADLLEEVNLPK